MKVKTKVESLQSKESSIKKSNEISMAEMNYGLNLNQMQLLAFAIYSTQKDGKTEFQKHEFQRKFGIEQYNTKYAYEDSKKIMDLKASVKDIKRDFFKMTNVFMDMIYHKGTFTFNWHPDMVHHILELKERYVITDLKIASHFKSGFSWRLYEYLKAHYGYFRKVLLKEEILKLFNVEGRPTYQKRISDFKRGVLDIAIKEVNKYTELDVWYKEQKEGRSIVAFEIFWNKGQVIQKATQKQVDHIQSAVDYVLDNMFTFINLDNENNRKRAFEIIEDIKEYKAMAIEPVNIDADKAHEVIKDIEFNIELLNGFVGNDKPKRDISCYYNWLEDGEG